MTLRRFATEVWNRMVGTTIIVGAIIGAPLVCNVAAELVPTQTIIGTNPQPVSCPTEDSCAPDYHDGSWYFARTRVTP